MSEGHPAAAGPPAAVLAIDGGNSKTDLALVAYDGTLLAQVRGPGVDSQANGIEPTMQMLGGLVAAAAREAGLLPAGLAAGPLAAHTSACLANADLPDEEEELGAALAAWGWSVTSTLLNDTFAVLRAGLDGPAHWGVAVTCGAGINCVGVGPDGQTTRFLALGEETGDWGGGDDLGMQALWLAMRAEDGRGPQTMLREAVTRHFSMPEVRDVAIGVHRGTIARDTLLELAPVLLEVAGRGDDAARAVVRRLADEVCVMALTAIRRLGLAGAAVPVVLGGSLLAAANPLLTDAIATGLAAGAPAAVMRIVDVPPIAGAALLGLDHVAAPASAHERLRAAYRQRPAMPPRAAARPGRRPRSRHGTVGDMQSVYEAAGGSEGLLRLAEAWHCRVMADEVVSHAFSHGFHPQHNQRLAAYWAEALGGPASYSGSYGDEASVVRIHSGNGLHEEMDRRAIDCFDQAMHDAGLAETGPVRQVLHDYFAWATTTTMSRYHDSADEVPDGMAIPRWSWDGLQH